VQPASSESVLDALMEARDPADQRALVGDGPVSADFIAALAARVRECLRKDPRQALTLSETCLFLARQSEGPLGLAHAHRCRAWVGTNLLKCADAEPDYREAAALFEAAGEPAEVGRTRIAQAENRIYLGDYKGAQEHAREAYGLLKTHGDAGDLARVHIFAGNLFNRLNRYKESLSEYDEARSLLAPQDDPTILAAVEMNRGSPLVELNRFAEALESLEAARKLCERHHISLWSDILERNIARLYRSVGRYSDALRSLNRARARHREIDDIRGTAVCDLACGEIYLQLNMFREAADLAARARPTFEAHASRLEAAQCLCVLGAARMGAGEAGARECFLEAIETFREEGNRVNVASMQLRLGMLEQREGNYEAAAELARRAAETYAAAGLMVLGVFAQLGVARSLRSRGFGDEAIARIEGALETLAPYDAPWVSYQCRDLLASLEEARGKVDSAERLYRAAIADIESLRGNLDLDEFRIAFGKDKYQVYERLAALRVRAGDLGEAFRLIEQSKSRTLIELLGKTTGSVWQSGPQGPSAAVRNLREELNGLYSRMSRSGTTVGYVVTDSVLREKIREKEQALLDLLREAASQEPWARLETTPVSELTDIQLMLSTEETLIEYCVLEGRLGAFLVDREGYEFFPDLAQMSEVTSALSGLQFQLSKFHLEEDYLSERQPQLLASTRHHLENLHRILIAPLSRRIRTRSLLIVPHGPVHYIPFQALWDGARYLTDAHDIVYGASATVLRICRERAPRPAVRDLVLAVPDERTPSILEEAQALAGLLPSAAVFVGSTATTALLAEQGGSAGKLHIAAHGVFRSDNPLFSSLRLGDGWLNMMDVFNLTLGAELTTLSACETGRGALYGGDELVGLSQAFLSAGTPSLVVSLWRVHDRSTTRFMEQFYQGLLDGRSRPDALRRAGLRVREEYPHPYYWAPFILMGKS
jgi:CHAT domain-containing protein/tetratricopeptide (TPR) repeat protein